MSVALKHIEIVPVNRNEIDDLVQMSWDTFYEAFIGTNSEENMLAYMRDAFTKSQLESEWEQSGSHYYFIISEGKKAGYLKINVGEAQVEFKEPHGLEIQRIYISKDFQGKGLGTQLLNFVFQKARDWEKQYIWLGVWEHNPGAQKLYIRYGFRVIGRHDFLLGTDLQTDILMRCDLH